MHHEASQHRRTVASLQGKATRVGMLEDGLQAFGNQILLLSYYHTGTAVICVCTVPRNLFCSSIWPKMLLGVPVDIWFWIVVSSEQRFPYVSTSRPDSGAAQPTRQPPPPRNCSKLPPALLSEKVTAKNDHEISFTRTGTDHKVSAMIRAAV